MTDMSKLPQDDFMYDKVDNNFLIEINMLSHFVGLSFGRMQKTKNNHLICEIFLVLKELISKHLPNLTEKVVQSKESQEKLDAIFKSNRTMMAEAVAKEIEKTFKKEEKPKIIVPEPKKTEILMP